MRAFRSNKVVIAILLLLVAGAAGTLFAANHAPAQKIDTQRAVVDVITSTAQMVNVPEVLTAVGHMRAIQSVDLSFDVSGHITKIIAQSGHRVNKGDPIAQLDDQSDAAQLTSLQADYNLAKSTYDRTLKLKQYGGVSAQQLDQNNAAMVAAQAAVQQQQVLISEKTLVAPFSGVLGDFQYSEGAYVAAGTSIVQLVQEAPLMVEYSVSTDQRSRLEVGQDVSVVSGAYPDKTFHGILNYISPDVDRATGTLLLQAKVDNDDYLLLPGMFVNVTQTLNQNRQLLMIPDIALMTDIQGQYVYQVTGNNVEKVYVKVGLIVRDLAEIKSGLSAGDTVVVAGQQKLMAGDGVNVIDTQVIVTPKVTTVVPVVHS